MYLTHDLCFFNCLVYTSVHFLSIPLEEYFFVFLRFLFISLQRQVFVITWKQATSVLDSHPQNLEFHHLMIFKQPTGESHIDFGTQCIIKALAGGEEGLLLMTFWNLEQYESSMEKDYSSVQKEVKKLRH